MKVVIQNKRRRVARGVLDAGKSPVGKLKGLGLLQIICQNYMDQSSYEALRGTPGKLDGFIQSVFTGIYYN